MAHSTEAVAAASTPGHFVAQPFRPQFLQTPGKPPIPWDRWKRLFDDWLLAIGFPDTEAFAARKAAILRASLGPEGSRIYYSLAPTTTVEDFTAVANRMQTYFGTTASDIYNRAQFTRHQQRPGETIAQFISTLRELAAKCNFPDSQVDERVRDQFAACCADNRIRERLLQEPGTKTLADLELLALTMTTRRRPSPRRRLRPSLPLPSVSSVTGSQHRRRRRAATVAALVTRHVPLTVLLVIKTAASVVRLVTLDLCAVRRALNLLPVVRRISRAPSLSVHKRQTGSRLRLIPSTLTTTSSRRSLWSARFSQHHQVHLNM